MYTIDRRCVPDADEREAPAAHRTRRTASAGRAGTARRTTAAARSPSRDRRARGCAARAVRLRASSCPYARYGVVRGVLGEPRRRASGSRRTASSTTRARTRRAPTRRARSSTSWVPPTLTSNNSRTCFSGWMTAAAWNTRRVADAVEQRVEHSGVAHVAGDDFDAGIDDLEQRGVVVRRAPGTGCASRPGIVRERADEVLAQPAAAPVRPRRRTATRCSGSRRCADVTVRRAVTVSADRRPKQTPRPSTRSRAGSRTLAEREAIARSRDRRAWRSRRPAARPAAGAGPADGRGLHARLPGAGAGTATSRTATSSTSTARAACGRSPALFKVFGVSLLTERLFGLAAADARSCSGCTRSRRRWGRTLAVAVRAHVGADHHPVRSHRARVGRRGRPRPARRSPRDSTRATGPTTASRRRRWALAAGVLLGLARAVPARPRPRGRHRRRSPSLRGMRSAARRNAC